MLHRTHACSLASDAKTPVLDCIRIPRQLLRRRLLDGLPFWSIHVIAKPLRERVALIIWNGQDNRFIQRHSGVPCSTRVGKKDNPSCTSVWMHRCKTLSGVKDDRYGPPLARSTCRPKKKVPANEQSTAQPRKGHFGTLGIFESASPKSTSLMCNSPSSPCPTN